MPKNNKLQSFIFFCISLYSFTLPAYSGTGINATPAILDENFDSTKITSSAIAATPTVCLTLDGVKIDGANATPKTPPYYGGNWFKTVAEVSAAFGGRPILLNGGSCLTNCPPLTTWNGSACAAPSSCVAGTAVTHPACGATYSGGLTTTTTTTTCPSGVASLSVVVDNSACTACPAQTMASFTPLPSSCASGSTPVVGSGTLKTTYSCPSGTAVPTTSVFNAGNCVASSTCAYSFEHCTGSPPAFITFSGTMAGGATIKFCPGAPFKVQQQYTCPAGGGTPVLSNAGTNPSCWPCVVAVAAPDPI